MLRSGNVTFFIVPVKIHTIFKYFIDFQHIFNKNIYQNTFFVKNHTIFKYFIDFQHIFNKNMYQNIFFMYFSEFPATYYNNVWISYQFRMKHKQLKQEMCRK